MGDMGDDFRAMKDMNRQMRSRLGVPCPRCIAEQPRRQPTILLPGRRCKVHYPAYHDPRPEPTAEEFNAAMQGTGWTQEGRTSTGCTRGGRCFRFLGGNDV